MIGVFHKTIASVPCLVIADHAKENDTLPTITYFHGFTSAKEHNLPLAYLLAEEGYRVILPDSMLHGEREQEISSKKRQISFWDIVIQNVRELKDIREELDSEKLVLNDRFGIAGTSMGGITTAAALTQYPWIKTAGILMGSPKITTYAKTLVDSFKKMGDLPVADDEIEYLYVRLEQYDLSKQGDKLNERPVLFWHGEDDPVVPFDHSYTFYEDVKQHYTDQGNIRFIKEAHRDHKVSRYAILETVKWFKQHL
ncbi:prolyl oligopeptidase family serine peptidase [Lentibacillus sp. CBA3610]|uniref:prolyl oligopeptidase family serine peptidase n=1 Tax=Lentibacillus sp. CBA3610 TaxID=2518176 RepID=UPI0015961A9F|nr:prolyl oligopeptidase family serine peptidase [Lentibacillus sp. CBA3610]QKY68582.1 esterase [Lentibacillus sp. CBA3610]